MIKSIKIQDKTQYPEGIWVNITHEKNKPYVYDEGIYFYVENGFPLNEIKVNSTIELDEIFQVIEIR